MKKALALIFVLALLCTLVSCGQSAAENQQQGVSIEPEILTQLFRIKAVEGQSEPQTLYYPTESGIAYISKTQKGYMGGYFMLPNLISNEEIFTCTSRPSEIFDLGDEKAAVIADGKLILLSLDHGRSNEFELNGKLDHEDIILGADGAFYYEKNGYILTADLAFDEKYTTLSVTERVVLPTEKLTGFLQMLAVSADGERMYYMYEENGQRGFAFFGIGYQGERLGATAVNYRRLTRFSGTGKVLFETSASGGESAYTLVDFEANKAQKITVAAGQEYASVTVNADGTHLVGLLKDTDGIGGHLDLLEFASGKRVKHYELADLKLNESLCATRSAKYLVVGQFDDGAGYDDDGGETVSVIQTGK